MNQMGKGHITHNCTSLFCGLHLYMSSCYSVLRLHIYSLHRNYMISTTIQFQLAGVGSCKGDSGGPLIKFVSDTAVPHYVQVGVVHGGIGVCGSMTFPGIYARLDEEDNLNFIRKAIGLGEYTARILKTM